MYKRKYSLFQRLCCVWLMLAICATQVLCPQMARAQGVPDLPLPGTMISTSAAYTPAIVAGITLHPDNPLKIDFIVDSGDDRLEGEALRDEAGRMIRYFMAALTVPEDEMWVNLSPYEKDRIIAEGLGNTVLGRDMLAQDYILKQLTASMMYPEGEVGNQFWTRLYEQAREKFGTTKIPANTFNKIWIVPEDAVVYVQGTNVFVSESRLKVLLEEDYLSLAHHDRGLDAHADANSLTIEAKQILRELFIPEIEREVNEGKNFAPLRQMYHALILAAWYKQNLKESVLGKVYVNQNKIHGVDIEDRETKHKIYNQYIEAFKRGVFDYIREDYDAATQTVIPRKYFSGGLDIVNLTVSSSVSSGEDLKRLSANDHPKYRFTAEAELTRLESSPIPEHFVNEKKVNEEDDVASSIEDIYQNLPDNMMGFSTPEANFFLRLSRHKVESEVPQDVLDALDAAVVETGLNDYETLPLEAFNDTSYESLVNSLKEKKTPIFYVDVLPSRLVRKISYGNIIVLAAFIDAFPALTTTFLTLVHPLFFLGSVYFTWQFLFQALSAGSSSKGSLERHSLLHARLTINPLVGLRSALSAEKIMKEVVPTVAGEKGRKPNILIDFGGNHYDIKAFLEREDIRSRILRAFRLLGYPLLDKTYINKVGRLNYEVFPSEVETHFIDEEKTNSSPAASDEERLSNIDEKEKLSEMQSALMEIVDLIEQNLQDNADVANSIYELEELGQDLDSNLDAVIEGLTAWADWAQSLANDIRIRERALESQFEDSFEFKDIAYDLEDQMIKMGFLVRTLLQMERDDQLEEVGSLLNTLPKRLQGYRELLNDIKNPEKDHTQRAQQIYAKYEIHFQRMYEFLETYRQAMSAPSAADIGGIDFNANNLTLTEQGQAADILFTNMPDIPSSSVQGVTPVIINVAPIADFPLLLGLSKKRGIGT